MSDDHSALVRGCLDYLAARGAWTFKVMGGLGQKPGIPDLLACLNGRLIGVECKTGRARMSAAQHVEADGLAGAGDLFVECRQIEDLERALYNAGLVRSRLLTRDVREVD